MKAFPTSDSRAEGSGGPPRLFNHSSHSGLTALASHNLIRVDLIAHISVLPTSKKHMLCVDTSRGSNEWLNSLGGSG
eukprot:scaffold663_cov139-Isochrysis_galbana.AAC.3